MFLQVSSSRFLRFAVILAALAGECQMIAQPIGTLARIEVQGHRVVPADEVVRLSGLRAGDAIEKKQLQASAERLMATGRFHRVDYRWKPGEDGISLTFIVVEAEAPTAEPAPPTGPKIGSVAFEGASAIPSEQLHTILAPALDDRIFREDDFRALLESLVLPAYRDKGHLRASFPSITTDDTDRVSVVVTVIEGPAYRIGRISVEGADPALSLLLGLNEGHLATRKSLDAARKRLADLLAKQGWLHAGTQSVEQFREDRVDLVFRVEPGPQFRFRQLTIRGLDEAAEKRARKLWRLKPGDAMDAQAVDEFVRAVLQARIAMGTGATREMKIAPGTQDVEVVVLFK
jgi:outer membrane protein assembly factor BamA